MLLTSAGLLMRSFINLQTVTLGLDPERLLFLRVPLASERYRTEASQEAFLREALLRIRAIPGVLSATTTTGMPVFGGAGVDLDVPGTTHEDAWRAIFQMGSADYFKTLGIPLLQGRELSAEDDLNSRRVAVVNHAFVQRYLGGSNALGLHLEAKAVFGPRFILGGEFEIVGVVADAKNQGIQEPPAPEVVVPYSVGRASSRAIVVRTAGAPLAVLDGIKRQIWSIDRGLPIANAGPVAEYLARFSYAAPRLGLAIFGTFAGLGLVLVVLGRRGAPDDPAHDARHGASLDRAGRGGRCVREPRRHARDRESALERQPHRSADARRRDCGGRRRGACCQLRPRATGDACRSDCRAESGMTSGRLAKAGGMAEWSMAVVLKTTEPETVPGVRIPLPPPIR